MSSLSALEALPTELVEEIAGHLDCKDCCSLRQVSQQLCYKSKYVFLKHFTNVYVNFHSRGLAKLYRIAQNADMAKAVKAMTIAVPDDDEWYKDYQPSLSKGTSPDSCCATGSCSMVLGSTLRLLGNLAELNIVGDYLDISHFECGRISEYPDPSRHDVVPAILHAIKQSGLALRRLSLAEPRGLTTQRLPIDESRYYNDIPGTNMTSPPCFPRLLRLADLEVDAFASVRDLRVSLGDRRCFPRADTSSIPCGDFAALSHAFTLARNLSRLDLHGAHLGCINGTLLLRLNEAQPQLFFPALHALRLSGDGAISSRRLAAFLRAHVAQLTELELVDLGLADDALRWIDLLRCVRDRLGNNLQRFRFAQNTHSGWRINGYAQTWWGGAEVVRDVELGPYTASAYAEATRPWVIEDCIETFDEIEEWVAVFVVKSDDGDAFEQRVEELGGMDVALDVMIEGYFEYDYSFEDQLMAHVIVDGT